MECAEDRQRDSEAQIAQAHESVEAAKSADFISCGPETDQEEGDAGGAHCDHGLVHGFPLNDWKS
jgi:hypothetical protein